MTGRFALVSGSASVPDGARADGSVADVPDEPLSEPRRARRPSATRYEVAADRPTRAVLLSGLPSILLVLGGVGWPHVVDVLEQCDRRALLHDQEVRGGDRQRVRNVDDLRDGHRRPAGFRVSIGTPGSSPGSRR